MIKQGIFPTYQEWEAKIEVYADKVTAMATCSLCGGQVFLKLNLPKGMKTHRFSDEYVKQRVIGVAQARHDCKYKSSSWFSREVLQRGFGDLVRGWEKAKERIWRNA